MTTNDTDSDFTRHMLMESAEKAFAELCTKELVNRAEAGFWPAALWDQIEQLGFTRAALPEACGGSDLALHEVLPLVRLAGRFAVPLPFGETLIAGHLLAGAGLDVPAGPLSFGPAERRPQLSLRRDGAGWLLDGRPRNIPWAASATRLALLCQSESGLMVASVDPATATHTAGSNLAGEPRTGLAFDRVRLSAAQVGPAAPGIAPDAAYLFGALLRGQQMAGALAAARDLAVRYTGERIAFGKPLNQLAAVQQNLAVLAGQAAAAAAAADMALAALSNPEADLVSSVGLAKVRINEAAEIGARLAHQAHGAIGFTYEHMLHHATRRLWSWRDEFGNDTYWSERVGQRIIDGGADNFWNFITRTAQL